MQIENGVVGEPIVKCGVDGVSIFVRTEAPFHGRIFVDEESDRPQCVHNYASGAGEGGPLSNGYDSKGAEFNVKFGECNMRRQRTVGLEDGQPSTCTFLAQPARCQLQLDHHRLLPSDISSRHRPSL